MLHPGIEPGFDDGYLVPALERNWTKQACQMSGWHFTTAGTTMSMTRTSKELKPMMKVRTQCRRRQTVQKMENQKMIWYGRSRGRVGFQALDFSPMSVLDFAFRFPSLLCGGSVTVEVGFLSGGSAFEVVDFRWICPTGSGCS